MPAIQTLMVASINEGTDLGYASVESEDTGKFQSNSSASIFFNTDGTVTYSGTGDFVTPNGFPATNWNTNGGTYISYEILSQDGSGDFTSGVVNSSTLYGENRYLMSTGALELSAFASEMSGEPGQFGDIAIKLSVWDSASGGTRKAYGTYYVTANAFITG